mmetsp:Transcript_26495/g.37986  ORF Transcript_26495/g.37986 Transcript_26495/m.37986 type:complete len:158 (+) Transcript_26495:2309-2782(+)
MIDYTFAEFYRDAVKALEANTSDFRAGVCFGDSQEVQNDDDEGDNGGGAAAPMYKSRSRFFTDLELIASRLDTTKHHAVISRTGTRRQCIMCCRLNHNPAEDNVCQGRQGYKVMTHCSVCEVPLCNIIRHDGKSCFKLFHEIKEITSHVIQVTRLQE